MRVTQGTFSYLPDLTDDVHPRNSLWDMWGLPMFDLEDASAVVMEVKECRKAYPNSYVRINAYDPRHGRRTIGLQFMVHRPKEEPGFRLDRVETHDRCIQYTLHSYAAEKPHGERYS